MKRPRSIDSIIYDYNHAVDGLIDDYQRRLAKIPTFTSEKRQLVEELEECLQKAGFGYYHGNPADCGGPTGLGNDTVLVVPPTKRGYFQYYRGQTVRLVCVQPGRYKRGYRVGPTTKQPTHEPQVQSA
jgi:hypothetical protein